MILMHQLNCNLEENCDRSRKFTNENILTGETIFLWVAGIVNDLFILTTKRNFIKILLLLKNLRIIKNFRFFSCSSDIFSDTSFHQLVESNNAHKSIINLIRVRCLRKINA